VNLRRGPGPPGVVDSRGKEKSPMKSENARCDQCNRRPIGKRDRVMMVCRRHQGGSIGGRAATVLEKRSGESQEITSGPGMGRSAFSYT